MHLYILTMKDHKEKLEKQPHLLTASKRIKYLGINLPKEAKTCTLKTLRPCWKKLKVTNRCKDISCSWNQRINILKMTILPKATYRFNPYQITNGIFHRTRTKYLNMCLETQNTPNSQTNPEGGKKMELKESGSLNSDFTTKLLSSKEHGTGHQKGMVLANY